MFAFKHSLPLQAACSWNAVHMDDLRRGFRARRATPARWKNHSRSFLFSTMRRFTWFTTSCVVFCDCAARSAFFLATAAFAATPSPCALGFGPGWVGRRSHSRRHPNSQKPVAPVPPAIHECLMPVRRTNRTPSNCRGGGSSGIVCE